MNYLKLMSILSEADADEYGVKTQKKKKDEKNDFTRSKSDQEFKDMHKVDVTTEKDFESLGPITTKQHDQHKGNPSSINVGDATLQSAVKKFDMGGIGKSSYRKIDKTDGQKTMPKVNDGVTKVLIPKKTDNKRGVDLHSVGEETEQLDELSPKTLNSYATKAQPDIRRKSIDTKKRLNRAKGVALARFKAIKKPKDNEV